MSMLNENRLFDYIGELTIKRSYLLSEEFQPKDDKTQWLFLKIGKHFFSFIYAIKLPNDARYEIPFEIELVFTMTEFIKDIIKLDFDYGVFRGHEFVGKIRLIKAIEH